MPVPWIVFCIVIVQEEEQQRVVVGATNNHNINNSTSIVTRANMVRPTCGAWEEQRWPHPA